MDVNDTGRQEETMAAKDGLSEGEGQAEEESEVERLQARLAESERRVRGLEVDRIRSAAAAAHGLPAELIEFITAEDETAARAQAAKLAAGLRPNSELPPAGGRNPANGGEQAARLEESERFDALRYRVPALNRRMLRH